MDIKEIMALTPFTKAYDMLTSLTKDLDDKIPEFRDLFDGKHKILNDVDRRDQVVGTGTTQRTVKHAKEVLNYQKRIVNSATTFLFGEPITLEVAKDQEESLKLILDVWDANKLDYFNKELARNLFVECKVAEYWYMIKNPGEEAKIRVSLLTRKNGYKIYPHFDDFGDMDAFTFSIVKKDAEGKDQETITVLTKDTIYTVTKVNGEWVTATTSNLLKMIQVVYYQQDAAEWDDVKTEIDRSEYLISNFADTNDYFGSPFLQVKGKVDNLPKKEETGKVLTVTGDVNINTGSTEYNGGAEFLTWDQAPESIRLEYDLLKDIIYGMTQTPDLSFANVKGLPQVSGITLKLMLSDAVFKARDKQEIFAPAMARRVSILKGMLGLANVANAATLAEVKVKVKFNDIVPADVNGILQALSLARGGEPIMSTEAVINANPLVGNKLNEMAAMTKEQAERSQSGIVAGSVTL